MEKVGILTFYYNNYNYGGQLQAYALQKKLNELGYKSEQICYTSSTSKKYYKLTGWKKITHLFTNPLDVILNRFINPKVQKKLSNRIKNFKEFKKNVSHSEIVYNESDIINSNDIYDAFICGSDQIWKDWGVNSDEEKRNYLLHFAQNNKKIISYAASLGTTILSDNYKAILQEELKKFDAVSVREKSAIDLIQPCCEKKVEMILDPVLLLEATDWLQVAQQPQNKNITHDFIFVYFLGNSKLQRKEAKDFAKTMNCRLATIPYAAHHRFQCSDFNFGDIRDYESGPKEFLWYIANAKFVLTDSFHAMVFSSIFHKNFYVFLRDNANDRVMNGRIYDFLETFGLQKCIVEGQHIKEKNEIDYTLYDKMISGNKKKAIDFIISNLK